FAGREQKVRVVGEFDGSGAQLQQRGVYLSRIPESDSQPALGQLFLRIKANRLAQMIYTLRRMVQSHFVNSKPKTHAAHSGPQLFSRSKSLRGILELSESVVDEPQIRISLGQPGLEPQDLVVLGNRVVKLPPLLRLLRRQEMFLDLSLSL